MAQKVFYGVAVGLLLCLGFLLLSAQAQEQAVTDICLGCICEAISGCNQTSICEGGVCGLFRITWAYWADAGKPTLNNEPNTSEQAYSNCVNDPYCAARAIQSYMAKFGQDCNKDGVIDCIDYAAIHKLGGYGCQGELGYQYVQTLQLCLTSFSKVDVRSN